MRLVSAATRLVREPRRPSQASQAGSTPIHGNRQYRRDPADFAARASSAARPSLAANTEAHDCAQRSGWASYLDHCDGVTRECAVAHRVRLRLGSTPLQTPIGCLGLIAGIVRPRSSSSRAGDLPSSRAPPSPEHRELSWPQLVARPLLVELSQTGREDRWTWASDFPMRCRAPPASNWSNGRGGRRARLHEPRDDLPVRVPELRAAHPAGCRRGCRREDRALHLDSARPAAHEPAELAKRG